VEENREVARDAVLAEEGLRDSDLRKLEMCGIGEDTPKAFAILASL
jgi:hypothetical protein